MNHCLNEAAFKWDLTGLGDAGAAPTNITLWAAQSHPETAMLALTTHDRDYYLSQMLQAGAGGYPDKNARREALLDAIRLQAPPDLVG